MLFRSEDTYVPLEKQFKMLKLIDHLFKRAQEAVKRDIPISRVKDDKLFSAVMKMKYTIPNDNIDLIDNIKDDIDKFYDSLIEKYS